MTSRKKECYRQTFFREVTVCKRLFRQVVDSCFVIGKFIGQQSYYAKTSLSEPRTKISYFLH